MLSQFFNWIWYNDNKLKFFLYPLSVLFIIITFLRKIIYTNFFQTTFATKVPIVIVGNLSFGGTGKTSFIIWLAKNLSSTGLRVGIISRGYKGLYSGKPTIVNSKSDPIVTGDEATLIAKKTHCLTVIAHNRVDAAKHILRQKNIDIILSDDGLQHYKMKRDYEFIMFDGKRGIGNGLCFPAGPLREKSNRMNKADMLIINEGPYNLPNAIKSSLKILSIKQVEGTSLRKIEDFSGSNVHAVAGIGNPSRFFDLLRSYSVNVIEHPLPDHADIKTNDLFFNDKLPVFITDKDAIKYNFSINKNIWIVEVELKFKKEDADRIIGSLKVLTCH